VAVPTFVTHCKFRTYGRNPRSDSVRFGRTCLDSAGHTWIPKRPGERTRLPAIAFLSAIALSDGGSEGGAPGAEADASVRRHERVRASSPPPFPPRPEPAILASRFPLSRFLAFSLSRFLAFSLSRFLAFRFSAFYVKDPSARSAPPFDPRRPARTLSHGGITLSTDSFCPRPSIIPLAPLR